MSSGGLDEDGGGDHALLGGPGEDEGFAVLSRDSASSLIDEEGDSVCRMQKQGRIDQRERLEERAEKAKTHPSRRS